MPKRPSWKTVLSLSAALIVAACGGGGGDASSYDPANTPLAEPSSRSVRSLSVPRGSIESVIDKQLARARGPIDVWVTLADAPVALAASQLTATTLSVDREQAQGVKTLRNAPQILRSALQLHRASVLSHQNAAAASLAGLGAKELGRVHMAHNAIAVRVDAARLSAIAALPGVVKVRRVVNHEMSLSETVPYIGASAAQTAGFDGSGVRVAVIDSGIDYTHRNLGGAGTPEAYLAAFGSGPSDPRNTTIDPSVFPTSKVVGGYDFVGDAWDGTDASPERSEDPNPIDFQGHGTHVADIIAGRSLDGTHKGVAPGAQLIAVKVCSSVASACNGVAILKAIDYALDPDGDGDMSDAVDVMNLSLGSGYGQEEDDSTLALSAAVEAGVVVAVAAGNDGNKPYVVSSPSIAPGVISVAQTAVPSESVHGLKVNAPASIAKVYYNTATIDWAPIGSGFTGDVMAVGTACPDGPALPDLTGKVALVDRGTCSISLKVDQAGAAGAKGVLIGLVAPGDAVSFSYGGGTHLPPALVIQQSLAQAIKAQAGAPVNVSVSNATKVPMIGSMASTSARGPSTSYQTIKPEIGAPGASVSALVGTGAEQEAFGGTSGATPMVAGAAAILIGKYPKRTPLQIKSMLMNSAYTGIYTNTALLPGVLAPVTRIGAGELRVNRALALNAVAYSKENLSAALSFGAQEVAGFSEYEKKLVVENLGSKAKTFAVRSSFRYADDEASGAVSIQAPGSVKVAANSRTTVTVKVRVDPAKLPAWALDAGKLGGSGDLFDKYEYDGYLSLTAGDEKLSVPWHILPRRAAEAGAVLAQRANWAGGIIVLANAGAADSEFDVFALTGTSTKYPPAELPGPGDGFALVDLRAVGVRYTAADDALQFAINTFGRRAQANYPGGFEVDIDTDRDGVPDFAVYNAEQGELAASGINAVNLLNLATGEVNVYYYSDVDFNSANITLSMPFSALGITPDVPFSFSVFAYDNYFTGNTTDAILDMTFTPAKPRYAVSGDASGVVRSHRLGRIDTLAVPGGAAASPSQTGFLVMMRRNAGKEAEVLIVK